MAKRRAWSPLRQASRRSRAVLLAVVAATAPVLAGCGPASSGPAAPKGTVVAVGAENEYGDVISQIGGRYVTVSSILDNPNTDPHTFESSPKVAEEIGAASLVVQNGVGYDSFMGRIESAASSSHRKVIDVQTLLGLPDSTANPHLWYDPTTMPAVARAVADDLSALQPAHGVYFQANLATFDASLQPWLNAIAAFKAKYAGTPVAVTEPVADYLLSAMGLDVVTPFRFQADIMNGTDPTPQDITAEKNQFVDHRVKLFCYNQQVSDSLTESIRQTAEQYHVPVVAVYETMPTPGFDYQSWMMAETNAIEAAVTAGTSTQRL